MEQFQISNKYAINILSPVFYKKVILHTIINSYKDKMLKILNIYKDSLSKDLHSKLHAMI